MRFRHRGLQNEDKLEIMFEDLRNTGDDAWCASSGVPPSQVSPSCEDSAINADEEGEEKIDDDSEPEAVTRTSVTGKRSGGAVTNKGKKPKTTTGHWFQEQMGKIIEMNERTTVSCESIAKREENPACSIQEVMALVKECGAVPRTNEHFTATILFTKKAEREMFMTLGTPEDRFDWLMRRHEWMTRNDVPK